jgi:hypothetical protein
MEFGAHWIVLGALSALLAVIGIDQIYERYSHKWTNEPPLLPYRIPVIGHALQYASNQYGFFRAAQCVKQNNYPPVRI